MSVDHKITLDVRTFHDGNSWYRAVCSCGQYRSKWRGYPGHAEMVGRAHAQAKEPAGVR